MNRPSRLQSPLSGGLLATVLLGCAALLGTSAHAAPARATPPSQNFPSMPYQAPSDNDPGPAPAAAKTPPELPAPATPAASGTQFTSNLYTLDKTLLASGQVDEPYQYRLRVTALEDITHVTAVEHLPSGLALVSAEPAAKVAGSELSWSWPMMRKGEVKDLLLTVRPQAEGSYMTTSRVCADPMVRLPLFAGSPKLEIAKTGITNVELGGVATFRITVRNTGTGIARNVVVNDELPDGLTSGGDLKTAIGDLQPGESRDVIVVAKAEKPGNLTNVATVTSSNGRPAKAQASVNVVQSRLDITKAGTARTYVYREASYQIVVRNDGTGALSNITVTDDLPSGAQFVSAVPSAQPNRGRLTWTLPTLAAGQTQSYTVTITHSTQGSTNNVASVTATSIAGKILSAKAEARTEWEGAPGVLTEIVDSVDPIRAGQSTTYAIEIKNQGAFKPVNGQIKVTLTPLLRPTSAGGDAQGTITGQVVTFPDVLLQPGRSLKLRIEAQGVKSGSGRARLEFMSSFLDEPIIKDESTFVY